MFIATPLQEFVINAEVPTITMAIVQPLQQRPNGYNFHALVWCNHTLHQRCILPAARAGIS